MAALAVPSPQPVALVFPPQADTPEKRTAFAWRALERLRLLHNEKGRTLPRGEFRSWKRDIWRPKKRAVFLGLNPLRDLSVPTFEKDGIRYIDEAKAAPILAARDAVKRAGLAAAEWDPLLDLDAIEAKPTRGPIDPAEDFRDYVEEDDPGVLTVAGDGSRITAATMTQAQKVWVAKDCGVDHWSGDYFFQCLLHLTVAGSADYGNIVAMMLANAAGEYSTVGDFHAVNAKYHATIDAQRYIGPWERSGGGDYVDRYLSLPWDADYWLDYYRVEADGTYGTLYNDVYTDAARTVLLDAQAVLLHENEDWRYLMALASLYSNQAARTASGYIDGLDLGEGGAVLARAKVGASLAARTPLLGGGLR